MAVTITQFFAPDTFTLGSADVLTEVRPPEGTRYLWITFAANAGKLAYSGTDGGAIGADFIPLSADTGVELQHQGDRRVYLASATGATVVTVAAVDRN
jgi:hypothetical protein